MATISLKTLAWLLTGSVGLLSDAAESLVNLVAAVVALGVLHWASKPADEDHAYGHAKVEYFSATGRQARSIILEADGKHLLTDVWTSVGVIVGVAAVALTGYERLDGIVALAVAANIIITGSGLLRRSGGGRMDRALDEHVQRQIDDVLTAFASRGVQFHALRTRQAGHRAFVSTHILVPGAWTVQEGRAALRDRLHSPRTDRGPALLRRHHAGPRPVACPIGPTRARTGSYPLIRPGRSGGPR